MLSAWLRILMDAPSAEKNLAVLLAASDSAVSVSDFSVHHHPQGMLVKRCLVLYEDEIQPGNNILVTEFYLVQLEMQATF